jgi:hypothetical protein
VCNEVPPTGRDQALVVSGEGGVVFHCPDWCRNVGCSFIFTDFDVVLGFGGVPCYNLSLVHLFGG